MTNDVISLMKITLLFFQMVFKGMVVLPDGPKNFINQSWGGGTESQACFCTNPAPSNGGREYQYGNSVTLNLVQVIQAIPNCHPNNALKS